MNRGRIGATAAALAAPALVLLAVVVAFLRFHEYDLLRPESLILAALAMAAGMAIGAVSRLRPATLGPAFIALTLVLFIVLRPELSDPLLRMAIDFGDTGDEARWAISLLGVGLFVAIFTVCCLLRGHLDALVAAVFGTVVLTTLVLPVSTGGEARISGSIPPARPDLPPIVHLILDEQIGFAGLPPDMQASVSAERRMRRAYEDFAVFDRAYSRFAETQFSLASLFNKAPGADVIELLKSRAGGDVMQENAWFDELKARGYAVKVYQTTHLDMCSKSAAVDACYSYPLFSVNAVQRSSLAVPDRLRVLVANLRGKSDRPLAAPLAAGEALAQFEADIGRWPRGVAYIVHLLLPHEGFMLRDDCSIAPPGTWEGGGRLDGLTEAARRRVYDMYLGQVACTSDRIARLFDRLKQADVFDDATIIVHGDHGSRIGLQPWINPSPDTLSDRDLIDHFSTLLAVKTPGLRPGRQSEPAVLQPLFAELFLGGTSAPRDGSRQVLVRKDRGGAFAARDLTWDAAGGATPVDSVVSNRHGAP